MVAIAICLAGTTMFGKFSMRFFCKSITAFFFFIIMFFSCSTPARITKTQDFALTKDTRVAVRMEVEALIGGKAEIDFRNKQIEVALLDMGLNVVPAEIMLKKNYTDFSISTQNNSTTGTISKYRAKYVPAAILISGKMDNLSGTFRFSIIDLKDERLLAYFDKYPSWGGQKKAIRKFIKDLSAFVEK